MDYSGAAFIDLDGTLLSSERSVSAANLAALASLAEENVLRVLTTGRSLASAHQVLPDDVPADFICFSTGAGTWNQQEQALAEAHSLTPSAVQQILPFLLEEEFSFMLHAAFPEQRRTWVHRARFVEATDFDRRLAHYSDVAEEALQLAAPTFDATEFIVFLPGEFDWEALRDALFEIRSDVRVVRATSPLDHESIWLEILSDSASKANAAIRLAADHGLSPDRCMAVGNDHNDLDLLEWAGTSFLVDNAPRSIPAEHPRVASNNADGVAEAVRRWLEPNG